MDKYIILRDGEIAVVIDNASIIMNVNTALEVIEKLNTRNTKDCNTKKTVMQDPSLNNTAEAKSSSCSAKKEKTVPVVAFEFDKERAYKWNDLREGVGKCIRRFDSMTEADLYYGVTAGTTSSVVNTWLPYINHIGVMNPMIGDMKNYRFSSKCEGKSLRWSLKPYCNQYRASDKEPKVGVKLRGVVLFREDAIPQFIFKRAAISKVIR